MSSISPFSAEAQIVHTSKKAPTAEDWERHRPLIKRLYIDERMKLKEVVAIMASQHRHNATLKMYKDRIKKWKLDKKNKEGDMLAILRKKTEREAVGKTTSFRVRGQHVTMEEVLHYFKRKKNTRNQEVYDAPTPSDISFRTPSPVPAVPSFEDEQTFQWTLNDIMYSLVSHNEGIPQTPSTPSSIVIPEHLFLSIKTYVYGSFERGSWVTGEDGNCTVLGTSSIDLSNVPQDFCNCCVSAMVLLKKDRLVGFRRMLAKVFKHVETLIRLEHPRTLDFIIDMILFLNWMQRPEIVQLLLRHILDMSIALLTKEHPWTRIWQLIGMLKGHTLKQSLIQSWRCSIDAFEGVLRPFHKSTFDNHLKFISCVYGSVDRFEIEKLLRRLLARVEKESSISNDQTLIIITKLGWNLNFQGRYAEAEQLVLDYVFQAVDQDSIVQTPMILGLLACSQYNQNKGACAEQSLRHAIQIVVEDRSMADPMAIDFMINLEE